MNNTRLCITCQEPLRGRSDKKFCDDHCRNEFHNQKKSTLHPHIRRINNALVRNRRILETLLQQKAPGMNTAKVSQLQLATLGFDFKHITHMHTTSTQQSYSFCYDYGYLPLEDDRYLVVRSVFPD